MIQAIFHKSKLEEQLSEELRFHLDCEIEKNLRAGMSPDEARDAALREFGGIEQTKEKCRDTFGIRWLEEARQDLRYGLRGLVKNPGFCVAVILSLALGIGANITIFNLIDAVLIRPLHIKDPHQLFQPVHVPSPGWDALLYTEYLDFKNTAGVFSSLAAYGRAPGEIYFNDGMETVRIDHLSVSDNYFTALGIVPQKGRFFLPFECKSIGAEPVLVLSGRFWKSHFSSDPSVLGKTVKLNNLQFLIVGVTPDDFRGLDLSYEPAVFIPLTMAEALSPFGNLYSEQVRNNYSPINWLRLAGRFSPNVNQDQASTILTTIFRNVHARRTNSSSEYTQKLFIETRLVSAIAISSDDHKDLNRFLFMLAGVVGFTLLITCASVANLLLARAEQRRKEMAVRLSLGAGRFRLIRQLLLEGLLLSMAGAVVGLLIMFGIVRVLSAYSLPGGVRIDSLSLGLNWPVLVCTAGLALLTTILFGMAPAWKTTQIDLLSALKTQGGATGRGKSRLRNTLAIAEIALCLPLLVGTGLFIRSMQRVLSTNLGYDPKSLIAQNIDLTSWHHSNVRSALFFHDLLERVRAMAGVISASVFRPWFSNPFILVEGIERHVSQGTWVNVIDNHYFETMRIPILKGRGLTDSDMRGTTKVAIINEAMARLFWPGQNPIGQRIAVPPAVEQSNPAEIVGVVGSIRGFGPKGMTDSQLYLPQSQLAESWDLNGDLIVRTTGLSSGITTSLQKAIQSVAPGLPTQSIHTVEAETWSSLAIQRFGATLLGLLSLLGVILATVGIYGLIAYSVNARTNEIGIRMALGANHKQILLLFFRHGAVLILVGIGIGVGVAIATTRLLSNFLFGVMPNDLATVGGVGILLAGIAFVATYLPARRAARVDPMLSLKYE